MNTGVSQQSDVVGDPWAVLGVARDAPADAVREAYLAHVRAHPPDRCPEEFERIRDAYAAIKDEAGRSWARLTKDDPLRPLVEVIGTGDRKLRYAGPKRWLDALREV